MRNLLHLSSGSMSLLVQAASKGVISLALWPCRACGTIIVPHPRWRPEADITVFPASRLWCEASARGLCVGVQWVPLRFNLSPSSTFYYFSVISLTLFSFSCYNSYQFLCIILLISSSYLVLFYFNLCNIYIYTMYIYIYTHRYSFKVCLPENMAFIVLLRRASKQKSSLISHYL